MRWVQRAVLSTASKDEGVVGAESSPQHSAAVWTVVPHFMAYKQIAICATPGSHIYVFVFSFNNACTVFNVGQKWDAMV